MHFTHDNFANRLAVRLALRCTAAVVAMLGPAGCDQGPGGGDDDLALRAISGLEFFAQQGCAACHCNNGEGGCNLDAPNIQGASQETVDARLRGSQTLARHPMKLDAMTDEQMDHLAAFLDTVEGHAPLQGNSPMTQGYSLYVSAGCITCHLASAQGVNQGGIGVPIAGIDPENIYRALTAVPCHPLQRELPEEVSPECRFGISTNDVVQQLTDTPPPDLDPERTKLAYFLAFIAPPPSGGVVEPCNNVPGEICTIAGNGVPGFTGDNVSATDTLLYSPTEMELTDWNADGTLDLGIVDWNNHRVRMLYLDVETEGVRNRIVSIAGTGKVTGTDALNHCTDLAFDAEGSAVLANWHNQNIYRYRRDLVSGGDRDQLAGLCDLVCSDDSVGPTRVDETFLGLPVSLAVHPDGRIFFSESGCSRIRILTIGSGPAPQQPPQCLHTVNLYEDGLIETLAGAANVNGFFGVSGYAGDGGPASAAIFNVDNSPVMLNFGIDLSPENPPRRLYVADSLNNCIRYIDLLAEPPTIRLFAGVPGMAGYQDGPADSALFNFPINVYVHSSGDVYVPDARNHVIRKIDADGLSVSTVAGTGQAGFNGDNRPATNAKLNYPGGVAVHPDGRIFIGDSLNNRVRVISP